MKEVRCHEDPGRGIGTRESDVVSPRHTGTGRCAGFPMEGVV